MKVISNKRYKELLEKEEQLKFFTKDYRTMQNCLSYEKAIVGIMKKLNLKTINISDTYLLDKDYISVSNCNENFEITINIEKGSEEK